MATDWSERPLGEVITLQRGFDLPRQKRNPGTVPIVSSSGISGTHDEARVGGPGVITGRYGTIGEVFYIEDDFWPLNTTLFVKDFKGNDPKFVSYFLRILDFESFKDKSSVPGINRNHLHAARVRVPELAEQRAIASVLGSLDDKIELNRRTNETLEEMARTLFKSWFVDFDPVRAKIEGRQPAGMDGETAALFPDSFEDSPLGEIPKGWNYRTLGELCQKPQYGYTASAQSVMVGPKFLRITDINKRPWVDWSSVPYCQISKEAYENYRVRPGDILIARMADPGHGVLIEESVDAVFASYLIRFRPKDTEYSRYIQYWLRSPIYWELVNARSAGTTRANLNAKVLSAFPMLIPDRAVVSAFRNVIESLRSRVTANVSQSNTLAAIRDALLPRLLSGEIRVREAEEVVEETA